MNRLPVRPVHDDEDYEQGAQQSDEEAAGEEILLFDQPGAKNI